MVALANIEQFLPILEFALITTFWWMIELSPISISSSIFTPENIETFSPIFTLSPITTKSSTNEDFGKIVFIPIFTDSFIHGIVFFYYQKYLIALKMPNMVIYNDIIALQCMLSFCFNTITPALVLTS